MDGNIFGGSTTRTKRVTLLKNKVLKNANIVLSHPHLTRVLLSVGISAAIGVLFMMFAPPEQALAWIPVKDHTAID